MHPGFRSRLIEILDDYQSEEHEDRIYRTGQNSTLAFLFHGPPGTGKSSLAWWVAYWFGAIELHQYSPDQVRKGRYVHTSASAATVYALHDIDRIISDAGDEEGQGKVRQDFDLNTLLNVLDGTLAGDNQIYILTANDASKIPEAVKSRCHSFLIGDPTEDMMVQAFEIYYDVRDDGTFRDALREVMGKGITIRALHKYCRGKKTSKEAISRLDELHKFKELEEHEKR
jgi:DNA polymerase III delta prime subunit